MLRVAAQDSLGALLAVRNAATFVRELTPSATSSVGTPEERARLRYAVLSIVKTAIAESKPSDDTLKLAALASTEAISSLDETTFEMMEQSI